MPAIVNRSYYLTDKQYQILSSYQGKTILYLGSYYKLNIGVGGEEKITYGPKDYGILGEISNCITNAGNQALLNGWTTLNEDGQVKFKIKYDCYYIKLEEVNSNKVSLDITTTRRPLQTDTYDMFCMPYNNINVGSARTSFVTSGYLSQRIASKIATELNAECYDIQLLPYCPLPHIISLDNTINLVGLQETEDYEIINEVRYYNTEGFTFSNFEIDEASGICVGQSVTVPAIQTTNMIIKEKSFIDDDGGQAANLMIQKIKNADGTITLIPNCIYTGTTPNNIEAGCIIQFDTTEPVTVPCGVLLWCTSNSFSTQINLPLTATDSMKIEANCNQYRLCGPNYQGSFDFNLAKNDGSVDYFTAYCTYKPYNPYIRVAPNFKGLYGTEFNDGRGLICSGDFSLSRINDAWQSYELQNKNYQNIFNREIQSLDFNNSIAMRNQIVSAAVGTLKGGATGAAAGAMAGGGIGAVVGAAVGTVGSMINGITDTATLAAQQKENRDLMIDKYNYQLGNIQALPYTLTKVGSFDISSKYFPFVEYYTCTDEEKEALELKIKYESMTVMKIGTLQEYKRDDISYIKGSLILADIHIAYPTTAYDVTEVLEISNQEIYTIYDELNKGV